MEKPPDHSGEEVIARLEEEVRQDDQLLARLHEDVRTVRGGTPVEDDTGVDVEPVTDEHGNQEP